MSPLPSLVRCKIGDHIHDRVRTSDLTKLPGYTPNALISFDGADGWQPAFMLFNERGQFAPARRMQGVAIDPGMQSVLNNLMSLPSDTAQIPARELPTPSKPMISRGTGGRFLRSVKAGLIYVFKTIFL